MIRIEMGYERTSCGCKECVRNCQFMPGFLIPSDLGRMIPSGALPTAWAEGRLLASPGAIVANTATGQMFRIRTLVPARKSDGSCINLSADNRCTIHQIAPFGCAFFDCGPERGELSHFGLFAVQEAWENNHLYARIWRHLSREGMVAPSPEECRNRMEGFPISKW
jgi:Fe-S-cluster containining protein